MVRIMKQEEIELQQKIKRPIVTGDRGITHWYECECKCPLNPFETKCQNCGAVIDWSSRDNSE